MGQYCHTCRGDEYFGVYSTITYIGDFSSQHDWADFDKRKFIFEQWRENQFIGLRDRRMVYLCNNCDTKLQDHLKGLQNPVILADANLQGEQIDIIDYFSGDSFPIDIHLLMSYLPNGHGINLHEYIFVPETRIVEVFPNIDLNPIKEAPDVISIDRLCTSAEWRRKFARNLRELMQT